MRIKSYHFILVAILATLAAGGWFVLNNPSANPLAEELPELTVATLDAQPIFEDLAKNHVRLLAKARQQGQFANASQMSRASAEINWASDIYEAIEIATAEDKPIFLVTFCRENCDPDRDV